MKGAAISALTLPSRRMGPSGLLAHREEVPLGPVGAIVHQDDDQREILADRGFELAHGHEEAAVADDQGRPLARGGGAASPGTSTFIVTIRLSCMAVLASPLV
jgi:hypothetical protein